MLEDKINQDLKAAMLAGQSETVTTLRGLKAVLLNVKVAEGKRDEGLTDDEVTNIFRKESKKRQESAELYVQGGSQERADKELKEKALIDAYLPPMLNDEALRGLIETAITETGATSMQQMGQVIGAVKQRAGSSADGGAIARLVKERLAA